MNKTQEALKMAIEAIEYEGVRDSEDYWLMMGKVSKACKEALAELQDQHQLKRLTDDEIEDIGCRYADFGGDISDWEGFANAIQDKLGVKQNEQTT